MEFDQLRAFYHTARLRSFTAAARALHLTQPAVSLKVKALEEKVGERLLERVGRRITLTRLGEVVYEHAEGLIARLDEVDRVVEEFRDLGRGRLRIGASDTNTTYVLPELLRAYRDLHPRVELAVPSAVSSEVVQRLLDRELDVGLVPIPQSDKRLEAEPLFRHRYVAIAPSDHRFAELQTVGAGDIVDEELVLLDPGTHARRKIEGYLRRVSRPPRVALEATNFEVVKRYVAAGLGVSLVPRRSVKPVPPGLVAVPLRRSLTQRYGLARRVDRPLSHCARAFLALAREHFGRPPNEASGPPASPAAQRAAGPRTN